MGKFKKYQSLVFPNHHYHEQGGGKVSIYCVRCGRHVDTMFYQGYCRKCYGKVTGRL